MSRSITRRLGLDHVFEAIAAEIGRTQAEVFTVERDRLRQVVVELDARIVQLGGRLRPGRPRKAVGEGSPRATKGRHT